VVAWHPGSQTVEIDSAAATGVALAAPAAAAVMVVPAA
jgi:hypothetical protein